MANAVIDAPARPLAGAARVTAAQRAAFVLALSTASRAIHVRDLLMDRIPRLPVQPSGVTLTPHIIASGRSRLDAVFAAPSATTLGTVLICHGIGEIIAQWLPIQQLLAARGVASLVFDYSGYGRSTGRPTPAQLEQDALAAFTHLRGLAPGPISLLGFSLGTGIAAAILHQVPVHRLVLCAAFTSFRAAARRVGIPPFLDPLVPPVWSSESALRAFNQPVLIVHSTRDRLFPVAMAEQLANWCGERARLHVVHGLRHNEPFYKAPASYWDPIAEFLTASHPQIPA
ncbi:MAG TPA: alpha/beta fold hydrolase [Terracidiphilus sp.]|nr:alpha/beta fold hydrolase [Terracidiphilus sp.]